MGSTTPRCLLVKDDNGERPFGGTTPTLQLPFDQLPETVDIPELIRKHSAVLRFPEKLMLLMTYVERSSQVEPEDACITWTGKGDALVIRDPDELVNHVLPKVFHHHSGRFSSFTRKLYRWGFRQKVATFKKGIPNSRNSGQVKIFFHRQFQRNDFRRLTTMKCNSAERPTKVGRPMENTRMVDESPLHQRNQADAAVVTGAGLSRLSGVTTEAGLAASTSVVTEAGLSSLSVAQQRHALLHSRSAATESIAELSRIRFQQAPAINEMNLLSSTIAPSSLLTSLAAQQSISASLLSPTRPFSSLQQAAVMDPFLSMAAAYEMESKRFQSALLLRKEWEDARNAVTALNCLAAIAEQKKQSSSTMDPNLLRFFRSDYG